MSRFRTALGEEFVIERRFPRIGWKPRLRGQTATAGEVLNSAGSGGGTGLDLLDAVGIIFAVVTAALFVLVAVPLLLFVAEVALVVALVIPAAVVGIALGITRHKVVLIRVGSDRVLDQRDARGLVGSWRAGRELRSAALAGIYPAADDPRRAPTGAQREPWSAG